MRPRAERLERRGRRRCQRCPWRHAQRVWRGRPTRAGSTPGTGTRTTTLGTANMASGRRISEPNVAASSRWRTDACARYASRAAIKPAVRITVAFTRKLDTECDHDGLRFLRTRSISPRSAVDLVVGPAFLLGEGSDGLALRAAKEHADDLLQRLALRRGARRGGHVDVAQPLLTVAHEAPWPRA